MKGRATAKPAGFDFPTRFSSAGMQKERIYHILMPLRLAAGKFTMGGAAARGRADKSSSVVAFAPGPVPLVGISVPIPMNLGAL